MIKSITICSRSHFDNHRANGGDKRLGNESTVKKLNDGRCYISGQKVRFSMVSSMRDLNNRSDYFFSNGDGISTSIENDIRADLFGFMNTQGQGTFSLKRVSPVSVTPAIAEKPSSTNRDLLIRIQNNKEAAENKRQALVHADFSESDDFVFNFHLEVGKVGTVEDYEYDDNNQHLETSYDQVISDEEKRRRIQLFINSTRYLVNFASQSRNAVSAEPFEVFISFDTVNSRKAIHYFSNKFRDEQLSQFRKNLVREIGNRGGKHFYGNDFEEHSVGDAYEQALEFATEMKMYKPETMRLHVG